jgi:3-methyladenine DNA glycosylase AlkD
VDENAAVRVADGLERELAALGSPERAEKERGYLKSELRHLGASVPAIRSVTTGFVRARPELGHDEVAAVVVALWDVPVHERRMAAVELLDLRSDVLTPADLPLLERMVREAGTWAILDGLAASVVGGLRERFPDELEDTLEAWSADPDRWVRRASLLAHLVALRTGREELDVFGRRADRLLEDRDPFVRKAIGWVLRDTGRRRPAPVVAWLEPRLDRVSRPTLREATRHLPDADRQRLLRAAGIAP